MIKKIVFDLDNTIMFWEDYYYKSLELALDELNIKYDKKYILKLEEAVDNYEKVYNRYEKKFMIEIMKKYSKIDLPLNFIDIWIKYLKDCYPKEQDKELISTLSYLSEKYDLTVLTNWFTESQVGRLKNYGILSYFKNVIGTDTLLNKPSIETFKAACLPYNTDECIMIGDSIETDVLGAQKSGMEAILFDYKDCYKGNLKSIKKISELKDIL